ncbi:MAG: alpha-ketoglutarate-dependent dioxygenase AlkB [Acidobacteriota bacterium]|nr:alpha-ketoglutarate-dependent dioxygenase AlkB [Acidobacteriota bacterium]
MAQRGIEVYPDAVYLPGVLSVVEQQALATECLAIGAGATGWYVPRVRGGGSMRVRMVCLGRHWNARTYRYETTRSDYDGRRVPPLPVHLATLASRVAAMAGMRVAPDVCILNYYGAGGKMGLHQDKDETPDTLAAGVPIVSLSVGDTAKFIMGGFTRKESKAMVRLVSGDGFVFGGKSRLRYHGVAAVLPGTAPGGLGFTGRLNLTFRQGAVAF